MKILDGSISDALKNSLPQNKLAQYKYIFLAHTKGRGIGIFAARKFPGNSIVISVRDPFYFARAQAFSNLIACGYRDSDLFQVGRDLFIPPYGGLDDYTNHSCEPTCGLRVDKSGFDMIALSDIAAGEELTYDYSTHLENPHESMICLCGAPTCRGVIRSFSKLPASLRQRYLDLGIVAGFINGGEARAT